MNDGLMTNIKMNGSPLTVGTKINYLYLMKYPVYAIIKEVNRFIQEGDEDDVIYEICINIRIIFFFFVT